jgi:hypothetical protein
VDREEDAQEGEEFPHREGERSPEGGRWASERGATFPSGCPEG